MYGDDDFPCEVCGKMLSGVDPTARRNHMRAKHGIVLDWMGNIKQGEEMKADQK